MRWTVEADTTSDVVSWPEEFDDFLAALRSDHDVERPTCDVDVVTGSLSARFELTADRHDDAEAAARRIMIDALERAGLRGRDEPLANLGVTPTR